MLPLPEQGGEGFGSFVAQVLVLVPSAAPPPPPAKVRRFLALRFGDAPRDGERGIHRFEPIQASLRVNAVPQHEQGVPPCPVCKGVSWPAPWYEHQNLRDERVEAFTSLLWEGVHEYTYVARATTPGVFVVPPAKAEEMYMPETFGRSATDRVIVE